MEIMNALLLEVKKYCYDMLQKIKRAPVKDEWRQGRLRSAGKYSLKKDRLNSLNEYYDFAEMEKNQPVMDYISGAITEESGAYADELAKIAAKLGKKS